MQVGAVQKLIAIFDQSFRELGVDVPLEKLEDLSVTIHRAMTVQTRHFHTLGHVFNFFSPGNAIVSLAALYHDIVYYQVDMGFSAHVWEMISPFVRQKQADFYIAENVPASERLFWLSLDIFDFHPGQKLPEGGGLNEFLSAMVMNKQLGGLVPEREMALMILCIEATIPFRGLTPEGKSHFELLEERLPDIFKRHGLSIDKDGVIEGIKKALTFANKDIENFAELDPGRFLDNTWKLLPETNAALRLPDAYSIGAYRLALQKMADFFEGLSPNVVFSRYRGVPPQNEYDQIVMRTERNIQTARHYLGFKILGISILEALARATGGDAPLSLFLGDVPREGITIKRLEYYLPDLDDPTWADRTSTIYKLLESGRSTETNFDMKNSPLSMFVYKSTSPELMKQYLELAGLFHSGGLSAQEFLNALIPDLVQPIALASSIMVFTRRQALLKFAGENHSPQMAGLL